jgi:leucyl-tRNA synthetase
MDDKTKYNPKEFEFHMQELWEKEQVYSTVQNLEASVKDNKTYCLSMFPYPSGAGLHVGHVRIYTGTDVMARLFRMQGKSVLHPMGWDAFGLPAENAAIKAKKNPLDMVPGNIANFKRQMHMLGLSYDWTREVNTTDPGYYKWTQWLFIQFFKMGLLYKKNTPINWCPKCKTGLAEEEVLANGTHERCGNAISKKDLPQWIFRITAYAERLLEDLKLLDWPKGILEMQRNWIGKKEGINIEYRIQNTEERIVCFTTRPDTNFGATFIVLAPEHPLIGKIIEGKVKTSGDIKDIKEYCDATSAKSEMERAAEGKKKTGVFTGLYAVNNLNGKKLPVWISDFVLMGFGTGAVVGVPGHDLRDFDFAQTYKIEVIRVVKGTNGDTSPITKRSQVQEEEGTMINSQFLDGMDIHGATKKIMDYLEEKGWGKRITSYHLRDWIFSRQRYWGEPIPMIFCESCAKEQAKSEKLKAESYNSKFTIPEDVLNANAGWFPLPEEQLPLELPYTKSYEPTDSGQSPLSAIEGFADVKCPNCGGAAQRETDTMPNWAGSCWYFIRFALQNGKSEKNSNPTYKNLKEEWDETMAHSPWAPVDWYLGGAEHAVLHLLYSRFWVKAMQDLGLLDYPEPFLRLRNVGMVLAEDHRKMSKSWGNTINPDDVVAQYGADTLRMYEMFMAPFNMEIAWSTSALQGGHRFLKRVWALYQNLEDRSQNTESDPELVDKLNKTIQKVGEDIAQTKFNTAIAALMEFLNAYEANPTLSSKEARKFIQIIAPFAPFITEKIWRDVFHEKTSVHLSSWPTQTKVAIEHTTVKLPIQISGKFRGVLELTPDTLDEKTIETRALKDEILSKYLVGKKYKLIYVKGRICNFVVS